MKNQDEFMKTVRARMQDAVDHDRENREESLDDLEQLTGVGQWPDDIRRPREEGNRPCLTINMLPKFVRQVTGDIRRMNPSIKVLAADNDAQKEVAEVIEGLVRHIQSESDASSVYEWAAECAAGCGIGWFRVRADWVDEDGFDQELKLEQIKNPLSVYCDPLAEKPTREDGQYQFVTSMMMRDDFTEQYPDAQPVDADRDEQMAGISNWYTQDNIVVADYYWKEPVTKTLHLHRSGQITEKANAAEDVIRKRTVESHKVMWAKVSGHDVLEGPREQPSKYLPLICVTGEEWAVGDRTYRSGVIRFAKDPQRLYNYWRSAQTELIALQPKAPYLATPDQIAGFEDIWAAANEDNRPYLPYNPDAQAPGAPQRAQPPIPSSGMMAEVSLAAEDMKGTTGVYDAALGARSNETSGVAIRQRQIEADVGTSVYSDNMAKAVELCGRILVDMIPQIYDTERVVRIIGADDEEDLVAINASVQSVVGPVIQNDMTSGKYAVKITVGPNYSTMRQEAAENMLEFVKAFPEAAQVTGDLIAKNMDWPGADQFAERLKKLLPPQVRDPDDMTPEEQQQMQAQMQQEQERAAIEQQFQQIEFKKQKAEVDKAQAGAEKAKWDAHEAKSDAQKAQVEAMASTGQIEQAFNQIIQAQTGNIGAEVGQGLQMVAARSIELENAMREFAGGQRALAEGVATMGQHLAAAQTAPKRVVRDERGELIGVETIRN